jgi:hypothetical protein
VGGVRPTLRPRDRPSPPKTGWIPRPARSGFRWDVATGVTDQPAAIRQRGSTPGRPPAGRTRARGSSDRHAAGVLGLERVPSSSSPIAVRDGDGCINAHGAPLLSAATNGLARLPGPPGFTCPPRGVLAILATSLVVRASEALAVCSRDFAGNQVARSRRQPTRHEDSQNDPGQHARPLPV